MRVHSFMVLLLVATAQTGAQVLGPVGARVDSALTAAVADGFSGVVRVDKDGKTILEKGYGLSNRADRIAFTPASVVQIGSNTKDFTLVALLQLQERGRLSLTDTLGKYFANAPSDKRGITLAQLVDHRAGFPIGLGGDFEAVGRQEFIDRAMARPLGFTPGTRQQYSNPGYALLAAVIELVSGTSYDRYVDENILKPLGLRSTGYILPAFDRRLVAHGYAGTEDRGTILAQPHEADGPYWNLRGNGGMVSTVDDMHAFYAALFGSAKLLSPTNTTRRFDPDSPVGLAGSDLVSSFLYERLPREKLEIIIATNVAEWRLQRVRTVVAKALGLPEDGRDRAVASAKTNIDPPPAPVAALLAAYVAVINSGDQARMKSFIAEHFIIPEGSPPADARAERMMGTHGNLGTLTLVAQDQIEQGVVELSVTSANEGAVTLRVQIEGTTPPKIRAVQVMIGG